MKSSEDTNVANNVMSINISVINIVLECFNCLFILLMRRNHVALISTVYPFCVAAVFVDKLQNLTYVLNKNYLN